MTDQYILAEKQEVLQATRDGGVIYYYESIDFSSTVTLVFDENPPPMCCFAEVMKYFSRHDRV